VNEIFANNNQEILLMDISKDIIANLIALIFVPSGSSAREPKQTLIANCRTLE
jgi:hypothetical protein